MPGDTKYWIKCNNRGPKDHFKSMAGDPWARMVLANMEGQHPFGQGDALVARDDLQAAGFKWGIDFYLKKEEA